LRCSSRPVDRCVAENLDEEDLELLEENLGVKLKRKKKFSRLKVLASDEEEDDERKTQSGPGLDRDTIASHLFDDEASEQIEGEDSGALNKTSSSGEAYGALPSSSEEEDDVDDFIVDEEGRPVRQRKKKSHKTYSSAQLQEAQDIFGVDLAQFADELEDEEEGEDEEEYEDEDEATIDSWCDYIVFPLMSLYVGIK
jgi:transcription elongation factor SPT6